MTLNLGSCKANAQGYYAVERASCISPTQCSRAQLVTTYHEELPSRLSRRQLSLHFAKKKTFPARLQRYSPTVRKNMCCVPSSPRPSGKAVSICDAVAPTHKKQNCPPFPPLKKILSEVTAQMRVFTYSEPEGSLQQHTHANPLLRTNNPTDPTILSLSAQPSIICKKQPQGPKMWVVPSLLVSNIYALALIYFGEFSSPLCHRVARILSLIHI